MADDKYKFTAEGDLKIKGAKNSVAEVEKLTKAFQKLSAQMDIVAKKSPNFQDTMGGMLQGLNTRTFNAINRNLIKSSQQTEFRIGRTVFKGAAGDKKFQEQYERFTDEMSELWKEEVRIEKQKIQEKYKELRHKETQESHEYQKTLLRAKHSAAIDRDRDLRRDSDIAYRDQKTQWLKYRNAHPEQFTPLSGQKKYIIGSGIQKIGGVASQFGTAGRITGGLLETIGSAFINPLLGLSTAFQKSIEGALSFAKASLQASAEIEALKVNLGVVFGSDTQATSAFHDISQYAIKSPFGIEQTTEMAILLKQSGVYATDLMDTLKMIGDTAGGNADKMKRIANNYAQITSIGKASMLDMRQFAYAGIPIYKAVSKELGVTQEQLRKMISDGKVTSDIIEKVFKDLTGVNGLFENATAKGAKTFKARLQNLSDAKQLFFSAWGDSILKNGIRQDYEKPGLIMSTLDKLEEFFKNGEHNKYLSNINKNVESIKNYEDRTAKLKSAIEFAKTTKNPTLEKVLTEALEIETKKKNKEAENAVLLESYNAKKAIQDEVKKEFNGMSLEEVKAKRGEIYDKYLAQAFRVTGDQKASQAWLNKKALKESGLQPASSKEINEALREENSKRLMTFYTELRAQLEEYGPKPFLNVKTIDRQIGKGYERSEDFFKKLGFKPLEAKDIVDISKGLFKLSDLTDEEKKIRQESIDILSRKTADWLNKANDLIVKADELEEISQEEIKVHLMDVTKNMQESAVTFIDKSASKKGSLLGEISSLELAISETEEAKLKEEKKQRERWDEALKILKSIDGSVSESGYVDFNKLSAKQLLDISKKGGFRPEEKLFTDNSEDFQKLGTSEKTALKSELTTRATHLFNEMLKDKELSKGISGAGPSFQKLSATIANDEAWYDTFNSLINSFKTAVEKSNLSETLKEDWENIIGLSLVNFSTATGLDQLDPSLLDKGNKNISYPLWKRIESSSLGIPIEAVHSTDDVLKLYHEDLSKRKASSNVFGAIGSVTAMQSLLKYGGVGQKDGTIYQVNWNETAKNIEEFALQLSASTKVIDSWKASLEEEKNTLQKLIFSDIFTPETQGATSAALTGADAVSFLNNLGDLKGRVAVNAFGEELKTKDGKTVKYDTKNNQFVLSDDGVTAVAEEELVITGKIYENVIKYLQDISNKLDKANQVQVDNSTLSNMLDKTLESSAKASIMKTWRPGNDEDYYGRIIALSSVLKNNPNYLKNSIPSMTTDLLSQHMTSKVPSMVSEYTELYTESNGSYEGIVQQALKGNETALALLKEAANDVAAHSKEFYESEEYKLLLEQIREQKENDAKFDLASFSEEDVTKNPFKSEKGGYLSRMLLESSGLDPNLADSKDFESKKALLATDKINKALKEMKTSMEDVATTLAGDVLVKPFEVLGETLGGLITNTKTMKDYWKDLGSTFQNVIAGLLKQIGPAMSNCGLQIAAAAAVEHDWAMVAGGLALAAAGGVATGLGSIADKRQEGKQKGDKEYEKAQDLKDQLAALLEQARKDALYYEMNLRHKTALGINKEFSLKSVNDAIISPSGDVITTHPDDYLIATKTPGSLNSKAPQTNISFKVINNVSDVKVRQEQRTNEFGETELIAIIESVVTDYIASPKGDDAFASRNARTSGRTAVM